MAYNDVIGRGDNALVPVETANQIISNLPQQSAAMKLFTHVTMGRLVQRQPVLSVLPIASFVSGDTGLKQTSAAAWKGRDLTAEEIAVIVPVPEALLDDSSFDIWGEVQPLLTQAIGQKLDAAVFFGSEKPASWPTAIVPAAVAAANAVAQGTNATADGGIAADISDLFGLVESEGFDVNGVVSKRAVRSLIRNARDSQGRQLAEVNINDWYGEPVTYAMGGLWPAAAEGSNALAVAGDFTQAILGVRQDITVKMLDQAAITDDTGKVILNLAQQDAVALRVVARFGFQVANAVTVDQPNEADRYPFAVLESPAVVTP